MFPLFCNRKTNQAYLKDSDKIVPITNGIPRFIADDSYASLFGDQWKQHKKTQLDSFTGASITTSRLYCCPGEFSRAPDGELVLEAGCGAGRFSEVLLKKGATLVSTDLSSAVEVNIGNFSVSDKHIVIQADINDKLYADEIFDPVLCMWVIQHKLSPERTIKNLYALIKKVRTLIIDHYTITKSRLLRLHYFYRIHFRKQPANYTMPATNRIVKKYFLLHKKYANNKITSVLLNRISPVTAYYHAFPQLNDQQQQEWVLLDTHDRVTDWFKHFRKKKQIRTCLQKFGAVDIWCAYGGNEVETVVKNYFN